MPETGAILLLSELRVPRKRNRLLATARFPSVYAESHRWCRNCGYERSFHGQIVLTWNWVAGNHLIPVAAELYVPPSWATDSRTLERSTGVPDRLRAARERWEHAVDLLQRILPQLPKVSTVLVDEQYCRAPMLLELERRRIPYVARLPETVGLWPFAENIWLPMMPWALPFEDERNRPPPKEAWWLRAVVFFASLLKGPSEKQFAGWRPFIDPTSPHGRAQIKVEQRHLGHRTGTPAEYRTTVRSRWVVNLARNTARGIRHSVFVSSLPPRDSTPVYSALDAFLRGARTLRLTRQQRRTAVADWRSWGAIHRRLALWAAAQFYSAMI